MSQRDEIGEGEKRGSEQHISRDSPDPLDFTGIEHAVNDAAKRVNAIWLALIFLMTYVLISTGKITHKDLFFESPVKLPIFAVEVPLRGYFVFVPMFILALHFYFSVQLSGLAEKFREYDTILFDIEESESHRERLRQRLDNSLFAKVLGGPRGSLKILMRVVSWISMVIAPLWLILFIQLTYLPEQDGLVTNWQRAFLLADLILGFLYVLPWILRRNNPFPKKLHSESRFAFSLRVSADSGWPDAVGSCVAAIGALWISFFVAILPWERSPNAELANSWFGARPDPVSLGPDKWFSNRLVLSDQNLIDGIDISKAKVTRSARSRNLIAAIFDRSDLRHVDFTGSDLSHASFKGTNLQGANLGCAYISYPFQHPEEGSYGGCIQLQEAILESADMREASLTGAKMFGASLRNANLNRATLQQTELQGATLDNASLEASNLWAIGLDGASMKNVSLIAASLPSARMRGADLSGATLYGAILDSSLAQDASFSGAQLQGASMANAHFNGANFQAAAVYGAIVSNSSFDGARVTNVLTTPRWNWGGSWGEYFASTSKNDSFGKESDSDALGDDGDFISAPANLESEQTFTDYTPISQAEVDRLVARLSDGAPSNSLEAEVKRRLTRLAPDAATTDWSKLGEKSTSEVDYVKGLGERLIIIACAKAGGTSVARGLIKSQMLCPFRDKINLVLSSGRRPDGAVCENMVGFWAALEQWSTCPKPKSSN